MVARCVVRADRRRSPGHLTNPGNAYHDRLPANEASRREGESLLAMTADRILEYLVSSEPREEANRRSYRRHAGVRVFRNAWERQRPGSKSRTRCRNSINRPYCAPVSPADSAVALHGRYESTRTR